MPVSWQEEADVAHQKKCFLATTFTGRLCMMPFTRVVNQQWFGAIRCASTLWLNRALLLLGDRAEFKVAISSHFSCTGNLLHVYNRIFKQLIQKEFLRGWQHITAYFSESSKFFLTVRIPHNQISQPEKCSTCVQCSGHSSFLSYSQPTFNIAMILFQAVLFENAEN